MAGDPFGILKRMEDPFGIRKKKSDPFGLRDLDRLAERVREREELAQEAGVPIPAEQAGPSPWERFVDVVSRPNYAIAGAVEEAAEHGPTSPEVGVRAISEFFSGIGGLKGEKRAFGQVLERAGMPPGPRFSAVPGVGILYNELGTGWQLQRGGVLDPSARGALGLSMDVLIDPTTPLSLGVGAAAPRLAAKGSRALKPGAKVFALSRKGVLERARLAESELPRAQKLAERFLRRMKDVDPVTGVKRAEDVERLTEEIAYRRASNRLHTRLMAEETADLLDPGGIKWAGRVLVPGERLRPFGKALGAPIAATVKRIEETPIGQQIFQFGRQVGTNLDRSFRETMKAAERVPGYREMVEEWRTGKRAARNLLRRWIGETTAGMDRGTVEHLGQRMTVSAYLRRALENEAKYPLEKVPAEFQPAIGKIREAFDHWFEGELREGIVSKDQYRQNYVPLLFKNSRAELAQFSRAHRRSFPTLKADLATIGPYGEVRNFKNLDEAIDFHKKLQDAGIVKWKLRPVEDLEEVLWKRGLAHYSAIHGQEFFRKVKGRLGIADRRVQREIFRRALPGVAEAIDQGAPALLGKFSPEDLTQAIKAFAQARAGIRVKGYKALSPGAKALTIAGRLASAPSPRHFFRYLKASERHFAELDPDLLHTIDETVMGERLKFVGSFSEPIEEFVRPGNPLHGYYLPRSIAEDIAHKEDLLPQTVLKELQPAVALYDRLLAGLKLGLTLPWPAFHVRNMYSDVAANLIDLGVQALNPVQALKALQIVAGGEGTLATPLRNYTFDEYRRILSRSGMTGHVWQAADILGPAAQVPRRGGLFRRGVERLESAGRKREELSRVLNHLTWMERGLTPTEAGMRVHAVQFDYEQLSNFERAWMRRLFPFYTWQKKNLARVGRELPRKPGAYAAQIKFTNRERGPDEAALPLYIRGDLKLKVERRGKVTYIHGMDLPLNSAIDQVFGRSASEALRRLWGSTTPALRLLYEIGSQTEAYTGREFRTARQAMGALAPLVEKMPKATQDYLEYNPEDQTMNGGKFYLIAKSYALSRAFGYLARMPEKPDELDAWAVDFLTGLKWKEFDLTELEERRLRNRLGQVEDRLIRFGRLKTTEVPYVPKAQ